MFTLQCESYPRVFDYLYQLLDDVIKSGQDPNYEVLYNGQPTGVKIIDLIKG